MSNDSNGVPECLKLDSARVQAKIRSVPEELRLPMQLQLPTPATASVKLPLAPSIVAGFVHGIIVMMAFANFSAMIFQNSGDPVLMEATALGTKQQLLSAGILIGILSWTGFFPYTMGGPTPPAAILVADVVHSINKDVKDDAMKVPTAMFVISLTTMIMGLMLVLVACLKKAGKAQQLPFPVLCGFLGSVGVLLFRSAIGSMIGVQLKWFFVPVNFDDLLALDPLGAVINALLGFLVFFMLFWVVPFLRARVRHPRLNVLVLPVLFFLPLICFYVVVLIWKLDLSPTCPMRSSNPSWLYPQMHPKPFWDFWRAIYQPTLWDFMAVARGLPQLIIASFLCAVSGLINMAGIETNAPLRDALDLDKEFMALGKAELVTALVGGHPGHHVAAFTLPMKKDGGVRREAPFTAAVLWMVTFLSGLPINSYVPRFFLGGCFLQVGFSLGKTFLWDNRKGVDCTSKIIAGGTVLASIFLGLNVGAGVSLVLVALNFIRLSMDTGVVRSASRVDTRRSRKYRNISELKILETYGHRILVIYIQGYLFFGSTDDLVAALQEYMDGSPDDPSTIYLDLRHVTGLELSVVNTLKKVHRLMSNVGISLVLSSIPAADVIGPQLKKLMESLPFAKTGDMMDHLQESEDNLLAEIDEHMKRSPNKFYTDRRASQHLSPAKWFAISLMPKKTVEVWLKKRVFFKWEKYTAEVMEDVKNRRTLKKYKNLQRYVEATKSDYGIRWEQIDGDMRISQTAARKRQAEVLVKRSMQLGRPIETFSLSSLNFYGRFGPPSKSHDGKKLGMLPDSWHRQKVLICPDTSLVDPEDFPRKDLAAKLNIRRVLYLPTADGVYELGSSEHVCAPHGESIIELKNKPSDFLTGNDAPRELAAALNDAVQRKPGNEDAKSECGSFVSGGRASSKSSAGMNVNFNFEAQVFPGRDGLSPDAGALDGHLSWNLLLTLSVIGKFQKLQKGELIKEDMAGEDGERPCANEVFVVMQGLFGTVQKPFHEGEEGKLLMKCPPGTLIGADDVWAERPRSVELRCLSHDGIVIGLDRQAVKHVEMGDSAFASPAEAQEFADYLKREMALNALAVFSAQSG